MAYHSLGDLLLGAAQRQAALRLGNFTHTTGALGWHAGIQKPTHFAVALQRILGNPHAAKRGIRADGKVEQFAWNCP